MKIPRPELIERLVGFATSTGGLVTGRPGVGKTYSVWECEAQLRQMGFYVLVVAVDQMEMQTAEDFQRLLGFQHSWLSELRADILTSTRKRGVLIFDAYDAARDDRKRDLVLSLIQQARLTLADICTTVVAVREFDAEKSPRLRKLFAQDGRLAPRISIPPLSEEELALAMPQISGLLEVHAKAGPELRALLHVPFFLWLLQKVWRETRDTDRFAGITSEVQLLKLLWDTRVTSDEHGTARAALVRILAQAMVDRRSLELVDPAVYRPELDRLWADLRSAEIIKLEEGLSWSVRFSHNILFDFAVAQLFHGFDSASLEKFFGGNRALPLFLRPSLVYHFAELWHTQRDQFWRTLIESVRQHLDGRNPITRLIIPNIVINETKSAADFAPWLEELRRGSQSGVRGTAFLLQAHRVIKPKANLVWAEILFKVSSCPSWEFAWDACIVIDYLVNEGDSDTVAMGATAARNFLEWCWRDREGNPGRNDQLASAWLIPLVGRTYATDPAASRKLLAPVLRVMDEPGFPVDCIYRLCNEVKTIAHADPEFAGSIYVRVFGYRETSTVETNIGSGVVLPLISNRRQDYEMCHYVLGQEFSIFLEEHPVVATAAALDSLNLYVRAVHIIPHLKPGATEESINRQFDFEGRTCTIIEDGCRVWDESAYPDQPMVLMSQLGEFLLRLASEGDQGRLRSTLDAYLSHAQVAVLWSRLLGLAKRQPKVFAPLLKGLLLVQTLQLSADLIHPMGEFLTKVQALLIDAEVRAIELSLLALTEVAQGDRKWAKHCRDRLIYCIPPERLQTEAARQLRAELAKQEHPPENRPLVTFTTSSRPYTTELWLADEKVDVTAPHNARLWHLLSNFEADEAKWREANPPADSWRTRLPLAAALLRAASRRGPDSVLANSAMTKATAFAVACIRRMPEPTPEEQRILKGILLAGATHPLPEPQKGEDQKWDSIGWSPTPRTEAAQGLLYLYVKTGDADALIMIAQLAADPVPLIRFLIASELWRLWDGASDYLLRLIGARLAAEPNAKVIEGLAVSIHNCITTEQPESIELARALAERALKENAERSYDGDIAILVTDLALGTETNWAIDLVNAWIAEPVRQAHWLGHCATRTRQFIVPTNREPSFGRAVKLQQEIIHAAALGVSKLKPVSPALISDADRAIVKTLYNAVNEAVMRLYFAIEPPNRQEDKPPITEAERREFYFAVKPVLDAVVIFGEQRAGGAMLGPTAHYFMQLLNVVVVYDPKGALAYAAAIATASKPYGYNLDNLAVKEVVELVETILADYRVEVQDEVAFNNLMTLLDAFIEVGWPSALALVWRLDEIYR